MTTAATQHPQQRLELVRAGQADRPWAFLPGAIAWLDRHPDDHGVRFLAGQNALQLGLPAVASDLLSPLPPEAARDRRVSDLVERVHASSDSEITRPEREARARARADEFADRVPLLAGSLDGWLRHTAGERWYRAIDGNTVRVRSEAPHPARIRWLRDAIGEARTIAATLPPCDEYTAPGPIVLEGDGPLLALIELAEALPPTRNGYRTPFHVVRACPLALLDALAAMEPDDVLRDPRVTWFVGPDSAAHYRTHLSANLDLERPAKVVLLPDEPGARDSRTEPVLREHLAAQQRELGRLAAKVDGAYRERTHDRWRDRIAQLRARTGEPLRVLILASRYTTFVQHAAADLARAVRDRGGEASVLIEPNDHSRLSRLAQLRAIDGLQPDLLFSFNYTRAQLAAQIPPELPIVCWIQDAMGHLFDRNAGAAQGPLDVLLGNHYAELYQSFAYDASRYLHAPVAVSEAKFHPGPVAEEHRARFECELAYVSHHSETPDRMAERLRAEADDPQVADLIDDLLPSIHEHTRHLAERPIRPAMREAVLGAMQRRHGATPPPEFVAGAIDQIAIPLAERIVRHRTLEWASAIARRRHWRLHLHGRGWDTHPTLADHARPELAHDDELRACYQLARAHLHASVSPLVHQRLGECAMSGGLPIVLLNHTALTPPERTLARVGYRPVPHNEPLPDAPDLLARQGDRCRLTDRALAYRLTDHPAFLERAAQLQRLGLPPESDLMWCDPKRVRMTLPQRPLALLDWTAHDLFGDLAEHAFTDEASLERLLIRAVEDDAWRTARSRAVSGRARGHVTHANVLRRLLDWFPVPA
ncbi:MAG: hypothetical protein ACF8Q5_04700 [Phycisphaerales bacterium JB040]